MSGRGLSVSVCVHVVACLLGVIAAECVSALADDATEGRPAVTESTNLLSPCLGFNPADGSWGARRTAFNRLEVDCQKDAAVFSTIPARENGGGPEHIVLQINCCALPEGVLQNTEHRTEKNECPDGYVVTGVKSEIGESRDWTDFDAKALHSLRCTKLNPEKFSLGPIHRGFSSGWARQPFPEFFKTIGALFIPGVLVPAERVTTSVIPVGFRYSVGRTERYNWSSTACIGLPFGSVLIGKEDDGCEGLFFRQIKLKHPSNTADDPLRAFSQACRRIDDPYSQNARCVSGVESQP